MKKIFSAFIALLLIAGLTGCEKDNEFLMGRWQLIEVIITTNFQERDTIDYSNENIVYDFQKNSRLIITGNVPNDFYVFKDFQAGKHSYKYHYQGSCPDCKPTYFHVDRNKNYKCSAPLWPEVDWLFISGEENIKGTVFYWRKEFVRI